MILNTIKIDEFLYNKNSCEIVYHLKDFKNERLLLQCVMTGNIRFRGPFSQIGVTYVAYKLQLNMDITIF